MSEPDVTLTDYALALLCTYVVWHLYRNFIEDREDWPWLTFFGSVGLASLLGGTVHGFFPEAESLGHRILWPLTLLSIGVTASSGWLLMQLGKWGRVLAALSFATHFVVVLFVAQSFLVVLLNYAPPMLLWLILSLVRYLKQRSPDHLWIFAGLCISFVAAAVQALKVPIHPIYFNHNALYHVVQAAGLWTLFIGARLSLWRPR